MDIKQKTRVFCSMLLTVPFTGGFYRKPYSTLVLNIHTKNPKKQENSSLFINRILQNGKTRVEIPADSKLCPETSTKKPFKNFISGKIMYEKIDNLTN